MLSVGVFARGLHTHKIPVFFGLAILRAKLAALFALRHGAYHQLRPIRVVERINSTATVRTRRAANARPDLSLSDEGAVIGRPRSAGRKAAGRGLFTGTSSGAGQKGRTISGQGVKTSE